MAVKIHARRQEAQADLVRKREVLDQLSERLSDLAELAAAAHDGNDGADTSEGEDILADIIPTPSESVDSTRSPDMAPEPDEQSSQIPEPLEPPPPAPSRPQEERQPPEVPEPAAPQTTDPTSTSQTLRPRHTVSTSPSQPQPQPSPSATAATTSRSSLFGSRPAQPSTTTAVSTTEAILDHQRAEQDALSESILKLASELKASSQAFSASLEEDKELVDRAGQGMAKTGEHMEGVTRKMGMLQRMTEGEGWWGRMRLYAMVYGLMVVLVLLVGVVPKLRF